jgi:hypothetical protein
MAQALLQQHSQWLQSFREQLARAAGPLAAAAGSAAAASEAAARKAAVASSAGTSLAGAAGSLPPAVAVAVT